MPLVKTSHLEETTVPPFDLLVIVACESAEAGRSVDDGAVCKCGVANTKWNVFVTRTVEHVDNYHVALTHAFLRHETPQLIRLLHR